MTKSKFWRRLTLGLTAALTVALVLMLIGVMALPWKFTTTEGSFKFLTIGSTIDQVIKDLRENDVHVVRPAVRSAHAVTQRNLAVLEKLRSSQGLVFRGHDVDFKLIFNGNNVSRIDDVSADETIPLSVRIGDKREIVFQEIHSLLSSRSDIRVFNFPVDAHWVKVTEKMDDKEIAHLKSFDTWSFSPTNDYSRYQLHFRKGFLVRIEYSYIPFELP